MAADRDLREFLQNAGIFPGFPVSSLPGWPAHASGVLTNDGNGVLSWGPGGGGAGSIGDLVAGGTAGSLLFLGAGSTMAEDNANLFFDDTNNQLSVPAGTESLPGLVFNKNFDTGLFSDGVDSFSVSAGGSRAVTFNHPANNSTVFHLLGGEAWFDFGSLALVVGSIADYPNNATYLSNGGLYAIDAVGNTGALSVSGAPLLLMSDGANTVDVLSAQTFSVSTTDGVSINVSGSAGVPSLRVSGNNGLFSAAGGLGVSANATEVLKFSNDGALDIAPSSAAVSGAARGRIRYDTATNKLQFSNNAGAWTDIGGGGAMAIGGTITSATQGSVLFAGASGVLQQDNANFFWDDTNNRLGLRTSAPAAPLDLRVSGTVALPAFVFGGTSDPDTGFWKPGLDIIAISTGGNERLRISENPGGSIGRVSVVADNIGDGTHAFSINGNLPDGTGLFQIGSRATFGTANAVSARDFYGHRVDLLTSGASQGTQRYAAIAGLTTTQGTNYDVTGWSNQYGNMGGYFESTGVTAGMVFGSVSRVVGGTVLGVGHYARAGSATINSINVGVVGVGFSSSSATRIGGFFSNHHYAAIPTWAPGAVVADSNVVGEPIFRGRNNNVDRFFVYETGVTRIALDGSASTPALYLGAIDDPNTGFFHPAADEIAITAGGSERIRFRANSAVNGTPRIAITTGTFTGDGEYGVFHTGTFLSGATNASYMHRVDANGAGSAAGQQHVGLFNLLGGYTGTARNSGVWGNNVTAQAAPGAGDLNNNNAAIGVFGRSAGASAGYNFGVVGQAEGSGAVSWPNAVYIGVHARSYATIVSGTSIGVFGRGGHGGSGTTRIGGYFSNDPSSTPSWVNGALVADSGFTGEPIFVGRNNNTTRFTIAETGVVSVEIDGTVSAPALTFGATADANTGIWHPAADTLAFSNNSAETMRLTSSNDVGIGVTPTERLSIKDHSAFAGSETQTTTGAVRTTDATQTNAVIITLSDTSVYWFEADVVGRRTDVVGDRVHYKFSGLCYREGGGAVIEAQTNLLTQESAGATAFDAAFTASGNAIRVSVQGEAAKTVNWAVTLTYQRVSGNT